jgi:hypothetical protein
MAHEIEKAVSAAIAAKSPFTAQDIYMAWIFHKSFDLILRGVYHCRVTGSADLARAIQEIKQSKVTVSK